MKNKTHSDHSGNCKDLCQKLGTKDIIYTMAPYFLSFMTRWSRFTHYLPQTWIQTFLSLIFVYQMGLNYKTVFYISFFPLIS